MNRSLSWSFLPSLELKSLTKVCRIMIFKKWLSHKIKFISNNPLIFLVIYQGKLPNSPWFQLLYFLGVIIESCHHYMPLR